MSDFDLARLLNALKAIPSGIRASTLASFLRLDVNAVRMALCRMALAKQTRCHGDLWYAR